MQAYWAQPEGQRLIFRHRVNELSDREAGFYGVKHENNLRNFERYDELERLREMLKDGPMRRRDLTIKLGFKSRHVMTNLMNGITRVTDDIWEDTDCNNNECVIGLTTHTIDDYYVIEERRQLEKKRLYERKRYAKNKAVSN